MRVRRAEAGFGVGLVAAACAASLLGWGRAAEANIFDIYGLGARGTSMGGAQGAAARDYGAVYYNPSLMTIRKKTHFGFSLQLVAPMLEVERPPEAKGEAEGGRDAVLPTSNVGVTAGVVFPLGGLIEDRIALGFAFFVPTLNTTRLEAIDPTTPQFVMLQALPDQLVVSLGVAVEPLDGLRLGVGAQILAALFGETSVELDTARRRITRRELRTDIASSTAPIVGVSWTPHPALDLGVTWRQALDLAYQLPIHFDFKDVGLLEIFIDGSALYTPDQWNAGVAVHLEGLTLAADLTWARWSQAPAPTASFRAVLDDRNLRPDDAEAEALLRLETVDFDPGFVDVLIPHLGAEYALLPLLTVRGGYSWRPTPVPNQVGVTNYLDADTHQLSLGVASRFNDPLEAIDQPIHVELFGQLTLLTERVVEKVEERDPAEVGDYSFGGQVWNFGVEFHHDF